MKRPSAEDTDTKHRVALRSADHELILEIEAGQDILDAALGAKAPVQHSCRRGDCRQCHARVVEGSIGNLSTGAVSGPGDIVLMCQSQPLGSACLEPVGASTHAAYPVVTSPAKVASARKACEDVIGLTLRMPPNRRFQFHPGQYVNLKLRSGLVRPYSIADFRADLNEIDFHIRLLPGGAFGSWAANSAEVGELLFLEGPYGEFFIPPGLRAKRTIFVATGTGLAPIYAMLKHASADTLSGMGEKILLWGNRRAAQAYLAPEMEHLARVIGIDYRAVFSQDPGSPARVTDCIDFSFEDARVFAAGHPDMITDLLKLSCARGLDVARFHSDAFTVGPPA